MKILSKIYFIGIIILINSIQIKASDPYQDTSLSVNLRVNDLISRMTLAEKISQLGNQTVAISRLGIQAYNYWNEALHGVARLGLATSFPQPIGLSATWDSVLIFNVASAISDEARVKNNTNGTGLTYWCPVINMARDPRWGRSEENFGEDTYLASRMAVNFIKGMQGNNPKYFKTVATAKHFACNNIENNRYGISSNVDERSLREYFLPTFKACVTEGKVFSIMSAYNAVNDVPCPANRTLLTNILRNEWGFKGFVVSDCDAVSCVFYNHNYVTSLSDASAISIRNGTDLNCGTTYPDYTNYAISKGLISESDLDSAVFRTFKARFLLGEFDPPSSVPYTSIPSSKLDCKANRDLALRAAREAIVLLKNQNSILPLNKDSIHSIAVIGPNSNILQLGEYSGSPSVSVTPLQGISAKLGINISNGQIEAESFTGEGGSIQVESCSEGGSDMGYIENNDYTEYDSINFGNGKNKFDIRVASNTSGGNIQVILDSLKGQLIGTVAIDSTGGWQTWTTLTMNTDSISGKHNLYLKFTGGSGYLFNINWFRFYNPADTANTSGSKVINYAYGCSVNGSITQSGIDSAVNYAKNSDVAILFCGTDIGTGGEGNDRTNINLPGSQEQLIKAVYHANPKTILVLETGFSLAINWEQDSIPAILTAWFDGQSQGTAIADILFGDYNPGGKLSTTWFKSLADLPSMDDYDIKHNRTYMYFKGTPLYPFGYGLSYTKFAYSNLKLSSKSLNPGESIVVSVDITNTGKLAGDEVVQLYIHVDSSSIIRPIKELKGFTRINLMPGATKTVNFTLKHDALEYYDIFSKTFMVENGNVDIYISSSSDDIKLDSQINVTGGIVSSTYRQNPFSIFEAENFENKSASVTIQPCIEGGLCIDSLVNNSYVVYKNFDFKSGAKQFNARLSSLNKTGRLQFVLDSLNGTIVGTLNILPTVDLKTYAVESCELTGITGVRDIYIVFKGGASSVCKLNWFSFQQTIGEKINTPVEYPVYKFSLFPNPTDSKFIIKYDLPVISNVKIEICSIQGILLKSIFQNEQSIGSHQLDIETNSAELNSGMYIIKFYANSFYKSVLLNILK
jgi:beta-glucosidase